MFTIAESLILLGTDDEKGTSVSSASLGYGLAGSILAELAMMERLSLEDDKVIIIDDTLTEVSYFNSVIEEIKADLTFGAINLPSFCSSVTFSLSTAS